MSWLFGRRRPVITLDTDRPIRSVETLPTQPATPASVEKKVAGND